MDSASERVAVTVNTCSRQTSLGGAFLRARSLSPVRYARQVPQVFGQLVEDQESIEHCENASVRMQETMEYSMNKGGDTHASENREEHFLVHERSVQRSTYLLRAVSYNLERPDPDPEAASEALSSQEPRPRIRVLYQDEAIRAHFCENAQQQLITLVQSDPNTKTTSALIAQKALSYRRASLDRIGQVDTCDPTFNVSSFLASSGTKPATSR